MRYYIISLATLLLVLFNGCRNSTQNGKSNFKDSMKIYSDSFNQHLNRGNYTAALAFGYKELSLCQDEKDKGDFYNCKLNLACVYDRIADSKKAIQLGEEALNYFSKTTDSNSYGNALSLVSAFHGQAGNILLSRKYAKEAILILKNKKNKLAELGSAYNQLGYTFMDEGNPDSAIEYIDKAIQCMFLADRPDQAAGLLLNNGSNCIELKNIQKAEKYLYRAQKLADSLGLLHIKAGLGFRSAELEGLKGNYKLANTIMNDAMILRDSLVSSENLDRISALETKYKTKTLELEYSKTKYENRKFQFLIVLLGLALFLLVFIFFTNRNSQKRKLNSQKIEIEKNKLALNEFTQIITNKNLQIQEIISNYEKEKVANNLHQESTSEHETNIEETDEYEFVYNTKILTSDDWETFKKKFNAVYPGFLADLRKLFTDLTPAEERLILLIKMKLTSAEISDILGISSNSVKKSRQRLRKKINLEPSIDLDKYIIGL